MAWVKEYKTMCFVGTDMYDVTTKYNIFLSNLDADKNTILAVNHSSAKTQERIYQNDTRHQIVFTILVTYLYRTYKPGKGIDK